MHISSVESKRLNSKNFLNVNTVLQCIGIIMTYTAVYADDRRQSKSSTPNQYVHLHNYSMIVVKYWISFIKCKYTNILGPRWKLLIVVQQYFPQNECGWIFIRFSVDCTYRKLFGFSHWRVLSASTGYRCHYIISIVSEWMTTRTYYFVIWKYKIVYSLTIIYYNVNI